MNSETFGERLKQDIIQMERHLETMEKEFGTSTLQYQQTVKVLEAKRRYLQSTLGLRIPDGSRGENCG